MNGNAMILLLLDLNKILTFKNFPEKQLREYTDVGFQSAVNTIG